MGTWASRESFVKKDVGRGGGLSRRSPLVGCTFYIYLGLKNLPFDSKETFFTRKRRFPRTH